MKAPLELKVVLQFPRVVENIRILYDIRNNKTKPLLSDLYCSTFGNVVLNPNLLSVAPQPIRQNVN